MKLTASDTDANGDFGVSVSLDGDIFVIGARGANSGVGKAYAGSVSSITTLDAGNASRTSDSISFESREDWIVGKNTDSNMVTLAAGDTATVTAAGKAVHIGQNAGSDGNKLLIDGTLNATTVVIGSTGGNTSNSLQIDRGAAFALATIQLTPGNFLVLAGDYTTYAALSTYLTAHGTTLQAWSNNAWITVDVGNFSSLISASMARATQPSRFSNPLRLRPRLLRQSPRNRPYGFLDPAPIRRPEPSR